MVSAPVAGATVYLEAFNRDGTQLVVFSADRIERLTEAGLRTRAARDHEVRQTFMAVKGKEPMTAALTLPLMVRPSTTPLNFSVIGSGFLILLMATGSTPATVSAC